MTGKFSMNVMELVKEGLSIVCPSNGRKHVTATSEKQQSKGLEQRNKPGQAYLLSPDQDTQRQASSLLISSISSVQDTEIQELFLALLCRVQCSLQAWGK